ncbi:hypothetical protein A3Q56_04901 [Intoshia linei]|uniref:Cullin family profile domain-containing protein n=1 Tax=Intoshia linei TaxID=1819745 RepID=A0A177AZD4_9BILA|nr:hypothetical protein A3Q56_04901 [Intoshia linei]
MLKKCLQNNQILKSSFDRAARKFLNKNAITEYQLDHSKYDPNKSSEYLSRYIDIILQQSNKVKTGVITEEDIDPIMIVFKFLESRDVFQEYICRSLSKRLCRSELILDDGELLFIQKLKEVCGAEYTNKLKQLFEDWKTSKSYTQGKFKEYMQSQKSSGPEMNINVFRSSIWPYATNNVLIAPNEMKPYIRHFEKFYSDMYTNRKLNWINSHGRAEIVTHGFSKQFVFVVSSIEATVLLLFNNAELYTFQRIKKKVPVPEATLAQIMHIFVMSRLVVQIPASTGSRTEQIESINDATVFKIYNDYNNKKLRINLNVPIKNELKTDNNNINRHIDEDRKTLLQAIIVKFVKTNKVCSLADIVNESKRATIGHFQITDFYIKKVIDGLVDKEYLTRDEPNKEIYHYVA